MFPSSIFRHRTHERGLHARLARLLIAGIASVLAACASQPEVDGAGGGAHAAQRASAVQTRTPPRLRRDSIARSAIVNTFGNVAIESAVDAPCGFRNADSAVVCLNVAGELNAPDIDLVRERLAHGATANVRTQSARDALQRAQRDAAIDPASAITLANPTDACRGACTGRIELARTR
jgi:hypothetical protein